MECPDFGLNFKPRTSILRTACVTQWVGTVDIGLRVSEAIVMRAEAFLGNQQLLIHPRNSQHFIEDEGSLLYTARHCLAG
jgi:hypothetical protein